MKSVSAKPTRSLNIGSLVETCDNSGARIVKIVSIKKGKLPGSILTSFS